MSTHSNRDANLPFICDPRECLSKELGRIHSSLLEATVKGSRATVKRSRATGKGLQDGVDEDEEDEEVEDDVDNGDEEDNSVRAGAKRRAKQPDVFISKDPEVKTGLTYLKVGSRSVNECYANVIGQSCIRIHMDMLFNAESIEDMVRKNPPISDEEMQGYLDNDDDCDLACTVQHFRVDFQRPWKTSPYNRHAKAVFVASFNAAHAGGEYREVEIPSTLLTSKVIGEVLDRHMEYRRKVYRTHQVPPTPADAIKLRKRKAANTRRQTVCVSSSICGHLLTLHLAS